MSSRCCVPRRSSRVSSCRLDPVGTAYTLARTVVDELFFESRILNEVKMNDAKRRWIAEMEQSAHATANAGRGGGFFIVFSFLRFEVNR